MPKRKRNHVANESGAPKWILLFLFSAFLAVGITVGLLAILANAMSKTDLQPSLFIPLTTALFGAAILLASIFLSVFSKGKAWLGIALAFFLFLALSAWSFFAYQNAFTQLWVTKAVAFLTSGALGGYLGTLIRERPRKIRR